MFSGGDGGDEEFGEDPEEKSNEKMDDIAETGEPADETMYSSTGVCSSQGVGHLESSLGGDLSRVFFEANLLVLDTSGSLTNKHSRPREVHFPHGYSRSHLTFDCAQA